MEIIPYYCDVAIARWEAYTGEQAILAEQGEMAYA
jgi:DNA modification methylase